MSAGDSAAARKSLLRGFWLRNRTCVLFVLLLPASAWAGDWTSLPSRSLVPLMVADTRESTSSVVVRTGVPTIDATVADRVGLVGFDNGSISGQASLAAGIHMGFDPGGELTFGLLTLDGVLRLPLDLRWRDGWCSLEWAHISAHYADGVRVAGADLPDSDERGAWSREYLRLVLGWDGGWIQPYLGFRELTHVMPDAPAPGLQAGWTLRGPWTAAPYQALDLKMSADTDWKPALSGQIGVVFGGPRRTVRLGLQLYTGPDDTGRVWGEADRYVGGVLGFDRERPERTAR